MPAMPTVPADRVVARFHTSGSTGVPQACDKRFGLLFAGHQAAASAILALTGGPCPVVGTSSFRHMFGFEATVTLPLWAGGALTGGTPFFPADVASDLAAQPSPALLVTTPYHLRKMLEADIAFPACAGVLSATAPLSPDLAKAAEARLRAPLLEIYGATELGMLATRRTSETSTWTLLPGFSLASAQALHDLVELEGEGEDDGAGDRKGAGRFKLVDRSSNLINVVGKRSSLGFLNEVLQSVPGVQDGVFCVPPDVAHHDVTRLAAFVVAPGLTPADVLAGLRPHVDPVFLPRPIVMLDALPRDANAKLPAAALRALQAEHLQRKGGVT
jgi:acyl-coenzyme A synthetase/AMP-(fatty) acid ligase